MVRWIRDRARLRDIAEALRRAVPPGLPPHSVAVSDDGTYLEYTVRQRNVAATVKVAVSETEELLNFHLPSTVAFIRKDRLLQGDHARLGD